MRLPACDEDVFEGETGAKTVIKKIKCDLPRIEKAGQ